MKPLPIDKAFQLYQTLAPYLPDKVSEDFNFVGTIIENIKNSGNHRAYIEAIALMSELPFEEVLQYNPRTEALGMFVEGLSLNQIIFLKDFCVRIGFDA